MVEVKGHIYGEINGQKYEFPVFYWENHMRTQVLSPPLKGPGDKVK